MPQINFIAARLRKLIWIFKNLRNVATADLLKTVYYSLCQSVLSYCISVWGGACKTKIIKVERAQRSVLKVMLFKPFRYPTQSLFDECQLLSTRQLFILQLVLAQHKKNIFIPDLVSQMRSNRRVCYVPQCNTTFARRHSYFLGAYLYNKINATLQYYPMTSYKCKCIVKNWLLGQNYLDTENHILILS